jgi:hypothetical protein
MRMRVRRALSAAGRRSARWASSRRRTCAKPSRRLANEAAARPHGHACAPEWVRRRGGQRTFSAPPLLRRCRRAAARGQRTHVRSAENTRLVLLTSAAASALLTVRCGHVLTAAARLSLVSSPHHPSASCAPARTRRHHRPVRRARALLPPRAHAAATAARTRTRAPLASLRLSPSFFPVRPPAPQLPSSRAPRRASAAP